MFAVLGLLPLFAVGRVDLDGQAAAERVEELLQGIGVTGALKLNQLFKGDWSSKEPSWTFSFNTDHGQAFGAINARTGRLNRLIVKDDREKRQWSNQPASKEVVKRNRRILSALGYGDGLDARSDVGFAGNGPYHILVHGLPFFNLNPDYGPNLSVSDPPAMAILFYAAPALPPVNEWRPKVSSQRAVEMMRAWGHARAQKRDLPAALDPSAGHLVGELGYWKPKNASVARLVWRASKYSTIYGRPYGMGAMRIFVDAATGKLVEPDDPLWGANP